MLWVRHFKARGKREGRLHCFCIVAGEKVHVGKREHVRWLPAAGLVQRSGVVVWRGR